MPDYSKNGLKWTFKDMFWPSDYFYQDHKQDFDLEKIPSKIKYNLYCKNNMILTLHNIHKHIKYIGGFADFTENPIEGDVLGLLLIDGLTEVQLDNSAVRRIINKHLRGDRDVFACQEDLINNGFDEFAHL